MTSHKNQFKEPVKILESCLTQYVRINKKELYDYCLEDPTQVLKYGDEVQKGLVRCIWAVINNGYSSTFEDVTSKEHPLNNCLQCDGYKFKCEGYRFPYYRLEQLRAYNNGIKQKRLDK